MARKQYRHSDETFLALAGHEAAIAREMECDPSYVYGIKNRTHPDPFPKFREMFRAAARAGADVSHWLNDLNAIVAGGHDAANEDDEDLLQMLIRKVRIDGVSSEEIGKAAADGTLDERECKTIIRLMRNVVDNAETMIGQCEKRLAELSGETRLRKVG